MAASLRTTTKPLHLRYQVDHGFLTPELGNEIVIFGLSIGAFFRWEFNSFEVIVRDGLLRGRPPRRVLRHPPARRRGPHARVRRERGVRRPPGRHHPARLPAGRPGGPEEIAAAVAYLASPEAAYVNGEVHHVNGGWLFGR